MKRTFRFLVVCEVDVKAETREEAEYLFNDEELNKFIVVSSVEDITELVS